MTHKESSCKKLNGSKIKANHFFPQHLSFTNIQLLLITPYRFKHQDYNYKLRPFNNLSIQKKWLILNKIQAPTAESYPLENKKSKKNKAQEQRKRQEKQELIKQQKQTTKKLKKKKEIKEKKLEEARAKEQKSQILIDVKPSFVLGLLAKFFSYWYILGGMVACMYLLSLFYPSQKNIESKVWPESIKSPAQVLSNENQKLKNTPLQQYSDSKAVDHAIDLFMRKRSNLKKGSLEIESDIAFQRIEIRGDNINIIYTSGRIILPVGMYRISVILPFTEAPLVVEEYISSEEDKTIAILSTSKARNITDLTRLINKYPNAVNLYTKKIAMLSREESYQKALNLIDSSINKFPNSAELYSRKARIISTRIPLLKISLYREQALVSAWKAVELNPSIRMLDSLSLSLASHNKFNLAIKLQKTIGRNKNRYLSHWNRDTHDETRNQKINLYQDNKLWILDNDGQSKEISINSIIKPNLTPNENIEIKLEKLFELSIELKGKLPSEEYCKLFSEISLIQSEQNSSGNCKLENRIKTNVRKYWHQSKEYHINYCLKKGVYRAKSNIKERKRLLYECYQP